MSTKKIFPNDADAVNYSNTQRILATTRLQQEILEQKERELDLKRDGRVRSISDEHICIMPNHINDADTDSAYEDQESASSNSSSILEHTLLLSNIINPSTIKQHRDFFENQLILHDTRVITPSPPLSHPTTINHHPIPATRKNNTAASHSSSASGARQSTVSSSQSNMKMPVSMQRFIASRGKVMHGQVSFATPLTTINNHHDAYVDLSAVRLQHNNSSLQHDDADDILPSTTKKVYRSAKSKISAELREMEEKEAEWRLTRVNLGLAVVDDAGKSDTNQSPASDFLLKDEGKESVKGLRQSVLLAEWEARSQQ